MCVQIPVSIYNPHLLCLVMLLSRVTRFEFVKKRTLCRGTPPPPPRWSFWTYFSHADDPAPFPRRGFDIFFYMQMSCTIVNDATSGGGKVLSVARLEMVKY